MSEAALNSTNPYKSNVSEKAFSGAWVPNAIAKNVKNVIEKGNAPFLPSADGTIKAEPIYNALTGYCLSGSQLIAAQLSKAAKGFISNVVGGKKAMENAQTTIKKDEKGIFYNFKGTDGEIHTAQHFFADQTEQPERLEKVAAKKIRDTRPLAKETITIESANPENYLGAYIAACKSGAQLKVNPAIVEAFKTNMIDIANEQIANPYTKREERTTENPGISALFFKADVKANSIIKEIRHEKSYDKQQVVKPREHKQEHSITY